MNKKLLLGIPTIVLAAGYVINDNEFRLAFDRYYTFPKFISGSSKEDEEKKGYKIIQDKGIEFFKGLHTQYLTLRNSQNNVITASFIPSKEKSNKYVILSHGYRNDGIHEFGAFIPFYYESDVNVLLVDHQAHGNSEGNYITYGYQEHLDLLKWIHYLIEQYGQDIDIYLHGISMGAATVCMVAGSPDLPKQVKGVISDCAYASAKEQLCRTMSAFHTPFVKTTYYVLAKELEAKMHAKLDETNPIEYIKNCKIPITFIHGMEDTFVYTNDALRLFDACGCEDKNIILVKKAGHAQSYWFEKDTYQQAILEILHK